MAATVELSESNGTNAAESVTNGISNINFGTVDTPNLVPATHPIIIGGFSYGKWIRLHVSGMGGSSQIDTIKAWKSSGAYVVGEAIGGNINYAPFASGIITIYAHKIAGGGGGLIVTPTTDNGTTVIGGAVSGSPIPTALPGSEDLSIGGAAGGHLNAPGYSDYAYIALITTGATPAGAVNQKIFTWQWNET